MATSPSFNWPEPDNTDLVKNGALAIRTAVDAIDTSMTDLLGGTTGQVLKKNSNTDMDFVWSADSAGMTNPMTTTGDTIYSSSGSTPARLGIGSSGQVLTVSGGVPTWATPSGGTPTYSGASIYRSTDLTLSASSSTTFTWDSESFDTDGYHSTSTNTDRFTIPAGKSGKFLLVCNAFVGTESSSLEGYYMKNGTDIRRFDLTTSPTKTMVAHTVLDLVATDYVIFRIYNSSGSSANCATGGGNLTQWSITYLGA